MGGAGNFDLGKTCKKNSIELKEFDLHDLPKKKEIFRLFLLISPFEINLNSKDYSCNRIGMISFEFKLFFDAKFYAGLVLSSNIN